MAVYTDINENDLEKYLAHYEIGSLLSYKGIAEGVENSNFFLQTTSGKFILTLYEKRVNEKDLPYFLGLMEHLNQHGLKCPLPLAQKNGSTLGKLSGRPAAIITFLEGISLKAPMVDHCFELGQAMAKLHLAGSSFKHSRKNSLSVDDWQPLWEKTSRYKSDIVDACGHDISTELEVLLASWPKDLPSGVIHADLFPDNVFFIDGKFTGLIDFYFACNDALVYDLAIAINAWCFEENSTYNCHKTSKMIEGYSSMRPLNEAEKKALPILCKGAAMRFFLTRLYDWLTTPEGALVVKKDPNEYLKKIYFFKDVGSYNQLLNINKAGD